VDDNVVLDEYGVGAFIVAGDAYDLQPELLQR